MKNWLNGPQYILMSAIGVRIVMESLTFHEAHSPIDNKLEEFSNVTNIYGY